ncbi:PREDICTED: uncharacterized protein LOC104772312 [Camelina sativa]|uniref:Uncharacterized protein LOC104772312 n=1 Tax=Camelina sativa TaxID=90675 RepID=A0ABM0Y4B5_CAMSA|nr:PREDICTED: uncharacterized protein LOC104772312 [Camelina sativa]
MRTAAWNCRGLGNDLAVQRLKEIKKTYSPDIIFLFETKQGDDAVRGIVAELGYDRVVTVPPIRMFTLMDLVFTCRVFMDLKHTGNPFSWVGKRYSHDVACCLDRTMVNSEWLAQYPASHVEFLELLESDHRPVITTISNDFTPRKGHIYFDSRLTIHFHLEKKGNRTNSQEEIGILKKLLDQAHTNGSPTHHIRDLRMKLSCAYKEEEEFWRIKNHKTWLASGDRNTKYFFATAKSHTARNKLYSILDDERFEHCGDSQIGKVAESYFTKLFKSELSPQNNHYHVFRDFKQRVTPAINQDLTKPVTEEEIKYAVFDNGATKAPGPDGFTGAFYQNFWDTTKDAVSQEVRNFFDQGVFDKSLNHTNICLIPKNTEANHMSEFLPIALCNVSYKIISKVLVGRLKQHLHLIISEERAAFIPGRIITDNVLIAHELIHALKVKRRCANSYMAIKTDITKAYDRLEWDFLQVTMFKFGFDVKWIQWIMTYVRTPTFSVNINGNPQGFIQPKRGISHMMKRAEAQGMIKGMKISNASPSKASGQQINKRKSSLTFGKWVPEALKTQIRHRLQIHNDGGCGKYLGLPEQFGQKKIEMFQYIVEKVQNRTKGWNNKFLSHRGKEILLKAIALAMPVYTMNCFKIPKWICEEIERIIANYWWNTQQNGNAVHWVAWDRLKYMKKEGGLGFRDIEQFNEALLAKQAWRILQHPNSLMSRILKGRYFSDSNILDATRGTQPSFGWQSLLVGRDLLKKGLRFTVGDETSIKTWTDPWLPVHPPRPPRLAKNIQGDSSTVNTLFLPNRSSWNESLVRDKVYLDDVNHILLIKKSHWQNQDYLGWHYTENGIYPVKSGYWLATHLPEQEFQVRPPYGNPQLKTDIWKTKLPPKFKHFLWRMSFRTLATGDELERRHISTNPFCKRCVHVVETTEHLFFTCPNAMQIWRCSNIPIRSLLNPNEHLEDKLKAILEFYKQRSHYDRLSLLPFWILWKIWTSRNKLIFQKINHTWQRLLREAKQETDEWLAIIPPPSRVNPQVPCSTISSKRNSSNWQKPPYGWVKCNYDGSFLDEDRQATSGWIVRDDQGHFKEAGQVTGAKVKSAFEAECQSLIFAMQQTWRNGYTNVIFEGDCQSLVTAINNSSLCFDIYNWIQEIKGWATRFNNVVFRWTSRQSNHLADQLAKVQRERNIESSLYFSIPFCILADFNSVFYIS